MIFKDYIAPEASVIEVKLQDVITTSDIIAGVETPTVDAEDGSWEAL